MSRRRFGSLSPCIIKTVGVAALTMLAPLIACAQVSSVSAWDAADFRIWGYIPYWDYDQVGSFATNGLYTHVSDVLLFGTARPDSTGVVTNLYPNTTATLRSQATTYGFKLHVSMMAVSGSQGVTATWTSIVNNPTYRAAFVNNVKSLMDGAAGTADDMKGFNFDWERPDTASLWGNYTQLARELRAALNPTGTEGREVTVCDYGSTDYDWDGTSLFDAKVYDQLFVMSYHLTSSSTGTYTNQKLTLTDQGAAKAFSNDQIAVGVGTWGKGVDPDGTGPLTAPSTYTLMDIVAAHPSLAYDALTVVEGNDTWNIESRKQVREKTQLALDRGMPGTFTWTLSYDSPGNLGLHRVMHHYTVVKRNAPDLNLDGKVNATDATTLANNMGTMQTNTGITSAAQFEAFYLAGNWEKGDHDGNGFVNQADADWLSGRYTALGVNLPDRLAYQGTFENFQNAIGVAGRWKAGRNAQNNLVETGNFTQNGASFLSWSGTGVGASKRSNYFVTLRNQNSAETTAGVNSLSRTMQADLSTNIDLNQNQDTYVTFLVRENTALLSASQLASSNRTLSLDFLNASGATQFDIAFRGLQQQFAIDSVADTAGQDVSAGGFTANATYLFVGKISGNGSGANRMQASLFPTGAVVANFTDPNFDWMLTALGSRGYNPTITDLQFTSRAEANYTISNVWIGDAATILPATLTSQGDFNHDGMVNNSDYVMWRNSAGLTGAGLAADGNGNYQIDTGDFKTWRAHFGMAVTGSAAASGSGAGVPEPGSLLLLLCFAAGAVLLTRPPRFERRRL